MGKGGKHKERPPPSKKRIAHRTSSGGSGSGSGDVASKGKGGVDKSPDQPAHQPTVQQLFQQQQQQGNRLGVDPSTQSDSAPPLSTRGGLGTAAGGGSGAKNKKTSTKTTTTSGTTSKGKTKQTTSTPSTDGGKQQQQRRSDWNMEVDSDEVDARMQITPAQAKAMKATLVKKFTSNKVRSKSLDNKKHVQCSNVSLFDAPPLPPLKPKPKARQWGRRAEAQSIQYLSFPRRKHNPSFG